MKARILLGHEESEIAGRVLRLLDEAGHEVRTQPVDARWCEALQSCHLGILFTLPLPPGGTLPRLCPTHSFVPVLHITDGTRRTRLAGLEAGASACLQTPFEDRELIAQLQALLWVKRHHDHVSEKAAEVQRINKRLQSAHQQMDIELELASRVQLSFLPRVLPQVHRVRMAVRHQLLGRVGGDFYDVFRLDENHLALYVADAMGHGMAASLLTIFVKKGLQPKEISGTQYRLLAPDDVLGRLNRDLVAQGLSDQPFITMVYGLLNHHDGTFQFARAGHPHPVLVPRSGKIEVLEVPGTLLGVFDTNYTSRSHRLRPGDKLLLFSDGMENVECEGRRPGLDSFLACIEELRGLPIEAFVDQLASTVVTGHRQTDDLTLLGLEMTS